jgi:cellulase/cellobiase CelA1
MHRISVTLVAVNAHLQRKCSKLQTWAVKALQQALPDLSLALLHKQLLRQAANSSSSSSSSADRPSLVGMQHSHECVGTHHDTHACLQVQPDNSGSSSSVDMPPVMHHAVHLYGR